MSHIHFFVEQISFKLNKKIAHRNWIQNVILTEKKVLGEINYIFCSDEYLLSINKSYLNHNTLTDIITFPTESFLSPNSKMPNAKLVNGEIYISIERVSENAKKFNADFTTELRRVLIHGVLHLCGYGDKKPKEAETMRAKEDFYIAKFNQS